MDETWEDKTSRLARQLKAARTDPFTSKPKERETYRRLWYELQRHIEAVPIAPREQVNG